MRIPASITWPPETGWVPDAIPPPMAWITRATTSTQMKIVESEFREMRLKHQGKE